MCCMQNANLERVFIDVGWPLCRYTFEPPVDLCNMWTVCIGSHLCESLCINVICVIVSATVTLSATVLVFR